MLDFASDSYAVIYSSGVLDGRSGDAAPDLWRYVPGNPEPELLWRNVARDRQLPKVGGDTDVWAFVETSSRGEPWWKLWVLTEPGGTPIELDASSGDPDTPTLVPSFDVDAGRVAWTAFHPGTGSGTAVSQLWIARAPHWQPQLLREHDATERAYWLPSLRGEQLAYVEVMLADDTADDVRHVMLLDLARPDADARQLDSSGNATMPILLDDGVVWKEPDVGFAMFNWGRLFRYSFTDDRVSTVRTGPQDYVNYPSGGGRFIAMWGSDASVFTIHDLARGASRLIARYDDDAHAITRPHLAGDLLVWLHADPGDPGGLPGAIEYAWLPEPGSDRTD